MQALVAFKFSHFHIWSHALPSLEWVWTSGKQCHSSFSLGPVSNDSSTLQRPVINTEGPKLYFPNASNEGPQLTTKSNCPSNPLPLLLNI